MASKLSKGTAIGSGNLCQDSRPPFGCDVGLRRLLNTPQKRESDQFDLGPILGLPQYAVAAGTVTAEHAKKYYCIIEIL